MPPRNAVAIEVRRVGGDVGGAGQESQGGAGAGVGGGEVLGDEGAVRRLVVDAGVGLVGGVQDALGLDGDRRVRGDEPNEDVPVARADAVIVVDDEVVRAVGAGCHGGHQFRADEFIVPHLNRHSERRVRVPVLVEPGHRALHRDIACRRRGARLESDLTSIQGCRCDDLRAAGGRRRGALHRRKLEVQQAFRSGFLPHLGASFRLGERSRVEILLDRPLFGAQVVAHRDDRPVVVEDRVDPFVLLEPIPAGAVIGQRANEYRGATACGVADGDLEDPSLAVRQRTRGENGRPQQLDGSLGRDRELGGCQLRTGEQGPGEGDRRAGCDRRLGCRKFQ